MVNQLLKIVSENDYQIIRNLDLITYIERLNKLVYLIMKYRLNI